MAQYDGSIRINTQINTQNASSQLMSLENRIVKTADKIASLRSKMDALKGVRIPTEEYKSIESDISKAEKELDKLIEKQAQMEHEGKNNGSAWENINQRIQATNDYIEQAKSELQELINSGKAFTLGEESEQYSKLESEARDYENALNALVQKQQELNGRAKEISDAEYMRQAEEKIDRIIARLEEARQKESEIASEQPRYGEAIDYDAIHSAQQEVQNLIDSYVVGGENAQEFANRSNEAIASMTQELSELKARQKELEKSGMGLGFEEYDANVQRISEINSALGGYRRELLELVGNHDELIERQNRTANGYKELKKAIQKFGNFGKSILTLMQKSVKKIENGFKKLGDTAKKSFTKVNKSANGTNNIFQTGLKNILKYGLGIRSLYALVNKFRTAVKEGFSNMYNDVNMGEFKNHVDGLRASLLTLKNAFAAAFRPLVDTAIPYMQKIVDYITLLMDKFGQLMAALTGQKTYTRAIRQTADAFKEEAEEVKETQKALEGYLSPLDEINKYAENKNESEKDKDLEEVKAPMFEEVPIDSYFLGLADKIKDIFSQIFAPLKEAWNREGKFVMDSWKYALGEVWDLIKSIGSDFLKVWQQEKTIKIFEDLLHIIGDIGLVVGNLAHNFRLAWEENETGKRILEGVRDIIGVIVANIRHAADATVEWSKNLDFSPFLTKMQSWIESLIPVFDALSGILTDFYEHVLLPLGKWVLEKGLPDLLQVFIDFNNKVDWDSIRSRLAEFWKHLEPFAETVGQGLIIFIGRLTDALANFMNSPAFDKFLTNIENWMDNVKPEDVADALEKLAIAIIAIKGAVMGFSAISAVLPVFKSLASVLGLFGPAGIAVGALALAGFLSRTIEDVDMNKVGQAVSNALKSLIDFIGKALGETDWNMLGQKLIDFIAGIDWVGLFTTLTENVFKILGNIIGGSYALINIIAQAIANLIIEGAKESAAYWKEKTEEMGGNMVLGILKGISDGIIGIGDWIVENIFVPFIEGFKAAFGIHSPSTVMAEMGGYIIEGLLNGIKSLVPNVQEIWESMKQAAVDAWNSTKESLLNTWENLKTGAKTAFDNIKNSIKESWENIKTNVKESTEKVKTNIANAWTRAKETTSSAWGSIKEKAVSSAQSMAASVKEKFGTLQAAFSSFSSSAQNIWGSAWEGMRNKVSSILSSIQNTISSVFSWISNTIGSLGNSLRNLVSNVFSFGSTRTTITGNTSSRFSRSAMPASVYSNPALAALSSTPIPKLATGAVIPANKEFLAVLGDQKHGTNIEAPLDTIKQAAEEAVLNVFSKIGMSGGNMNGTPINLTLQVTLDKQVLGQKMVDWGKLQQMATGSNPYALGNT